MTTATVPPEGFGSRLAARVSKARLSTAPPPAFTDGEVQRNGSDSDGFKGETNCEVKYGVKSGQVKFQVSKEKLFHSRIPFSLATSA